MPIRSPTRARLLLLLSLGACGDAAQQPEDAPLLTFDSTHVRLATAADTVDLAVEIANDPDRRAVGLMERTALGRDAGMLFVYPEEQPAEAGFWMFHTRIPLDIAFLDRSGRIVAMLAMEPCESPDPRWCDEHAPGVPYLAALEVNRGYLQERGVAVGDRVLLPEGGFPAAR